MLKHIKKKEATLASRRLHHIIIWIWSKTTSVIFVWKILAHQIFL